MMQITSNANKTYRFIKSLSAKKARMEHGCFLVEGIKSVQEVLASDASVRVVAVRESATDKCGKLLQAAQERAVDVCTVTDSLFASACDTKTPEGALCVVEMAGESFAAKEGVYLYCDRVSDPGNAGTLIRCADAVGAAGVLFSKNSVDIYSPKTIRATMGSFFHVPVYDNVEETVLLDMKKQGFCLLAGALTAEAVDYRDADYPAKTVVVIGNEANGVSDAVLSVCDFPVIIPIAGRAESLNASVAGALLLYEWARKNGR